MTRPASWLAPAWDAPGVGALMTSRDGGRSDAPYATMNLGDAVGDDDVRVSANRALLASACAAVPVFLRQVHGVRVVRLGAAAAAPGAPTETADASVTTEPGIACTVLLADCLPVLLAAPGARGVAAAHAGWRGLAGGVLESALAALCEAARCAPSELRAWLGASIGPDAFEVGADVLEAFGVDPSAGTTPRFRPHRAGKWLADLPGLAHDRLRDAGVHAVSTAGLCTVADTSRFFSYRRDGVTGRMAAAVWITGAGGG